jgi:putative phosphoesterase
MKIAIMSDTHDNTPAIVWIIEYLNQHQISVAFHAGDMINPGILFRFRDHYQGHLHFIFGNNDGEHYFAAKRAEAAENLTCHGPHMELELENKKIFMQHYSDIVERVAKSGEFDVCIGGHDHKYRVIKHGASLFINPGNTVTKDKWLLTKQDHESSFVILDLETMEAERVMVPNKL